MNDSSRVAIFRTEEIEASARGAIVDLCVAAHHEDDFKNLFTYVPRGGLHFLLFHGEELVSHALVTTRWLQPESQPLLKTAYVDAVATLPGLQRRGHGSTLMRHLASRIEGDYAIACLETDRIEFYRPLGWELWRGPLAGRSEHGLIPTPEQTGIMILRLSRTPALDLNSTLTIECQETRIW